MFHRLTSAAIAIVATVAAAITFGATLTPTSSASATDRRAPRDTHVTCVGSSRSCTASISLAHGASNGKVSIALPATGLRLVSARPTSSNLDGAYLISDQRMKAARRTYTFTLNAAKAPAGSALTFTFRKPGTATPTILRCTGAKVCKVKVPLGGGASNRHVVVQLPRTDLGLVSVKPSRPVLRGAYSISDQRLRAGHSEYEFVLNAVRSTPARSHLTLTFAVAH